jgi:WD40 repeat protein
MFALGTSSGMIKLFSLKGYELEIHDAHDNAIHKLAFFPNKGFLVSIDITNLLKLWRLSDLDDCEIQLKIPEDSPNTRVSCLYIPSFITS